MTTASVRVLEASGLVRVPAARPPLQLAPAAPALTPGLRSLLTRVAAGRGPSVPKPAACVAIPRRVGTLAHPLCTCASPAGKRTCRQHKGIAGFGYIVAPAVPRKRKS